MGTEVGFEHFYEFYGKVNVLSKITGQKNKPFKDITSFNTIFGDAHRESPLEPTGYTQTLTTVLDTQHDSSTLIEPLIYKPEKSTTPESDNIAKKLLIGDFDSNRCDLTISSGVNAIPDPDWFDHKLVSIFNIHENDAQSNIADLHLIIPDYSSPIKNLFTFHNYRVGNESLKMDQYVWKSKYNMLALLTQSFLLLTFDMYYYNNNNTPLFRSNFDIMPRKSAEQTDQKAATQLATLAVTKNIKDKKIGELQDEKATLEAKLQAETIKADTLAESIRHTNNDMYKQTRAADREDVMQRLFNKDPQLRQSLTRQESIAQEIKRVEINMEKATTELETITKELAKITKSITDTKQQTDVEEDSEWNKKKITLSDLLSIETFSPNKLPTFLMLLIYYAGYSFNIDTHDITSKFRNKFNQSSNKTSFPIKLYVPIAHPNETKYNNKVTGPIKPETVDLSIETLQVYHVGIKIASLWDYVNGKLTILISNMLNSNRDNTVKEGIIKTLFKKTYNSNKLFLFECISELKKYKEYILNSSNIQSIEFPMSTLKTLEILILKLSYILSVLEPTFIPIETMSFDVTMNGKILKYVINSELQATNISIDDHISNDKLMSAILSTRAASIEPDDTGKAKARNLLSESTALELEKSVIQKEVDTCTTNRLVKLIAYKKIEREWIRSLANYEPIKKDQERKHTEDGLNTAIQHYKLELEFYKAQQEYNVADEVNDAANKLSNAFTENSVPPPELFNKFRKPTKEITSENIEKTRDSIEKIMKRLQHKTIQLQDLKAKSPEYRARIAADDNRKEANKILHHNEDARRSRAQAIDSDVVQTIGVIRKSHIADNNQCGFRFGKFNTVITHDYELGKIVNIERSGIGNKDPRELDIFKGIGRGFILQRIDRHPYGNGVPTTVWNNDPHLSLGQNPHLSLEQKTAEELLLDSFKKDPNYIKTKKDFERAYRSKSISETELDRRENNIFRLQYLLWTLNHLDIGTMYTFTFKPPQLEPTSTGDPGFSSGGKNTTKKVYRNQRQRHGQTHSKTKKVFES